MNKALYKIKSFTKYSCHFDLGLLATFDCRGFDRRISSQCNILLIRKIPNGYCTYDEIIVQQEKVTVIAADIHGMCYIYDFIFQNPTYSCKQRTPLKCVHNFLNSADVILCKKLRCIYISVNYIVF